MPSRSRSLIAVVSCASMIQLASIPPAWAKKPSAADRSKRVSEIEDAKARAREMVVRGTEAFRAGRYAEAARLFLEAHALLATRGLEIKPELLHNAAVAYERIDDCAKSAELFERFLEAKPSARSDQTVMKSYEHASLCAPKVTIVSDPPAEAVVDGEARGKTPLDLHLKVGTHPLVLNATGYQQLESTLEIDAPRTIALSLEPTAVPEPPPEISAAKEPPPQEPLHVTAAPTSEESATTPWIWASAGIGVAALAAGIVFGARSSSEHSVYDEQLAKRDDCECRDLSLIKSSRDRSTNLAIAADISFGAAIVGAVVTGVLLLSGSSSPAETGDAAGSGSTSISFSW